jgi:hypothetical protein
VEIASGVESRSRSRSEGVSMLGSRTILIVDGSTYAALDLAAAVELNGGRAAGPVSTLSDALEILARGDVAGAVVDCELADAATLIMHLAEAGMPLVVQTSIALPLALERLDGRLPVLMRPVAPRTVIDTLVGELGKKAQPGMEGPAPHEEVHRLEHRPKQV